MKKILVLGAGLSSSYLIRYLSEHAENEKWEITVADADEEHAGKKVAGHKHTRALQLNIQDSFACSELISKHDIVVSLLPPTMHVLVAHDCILHGRHLVTASYISPDMQNLHASALKAGVVLLNECGLDPGIDHLSAMKLINGIRHDGGTVTSFKSFCGGLVAPEYDDNPWHYKFTWNPRNVVLAGQAAAKFLDRGELKFIPQSRIFTQTESLNIDGHGEFESYANRDSLSYIGPYGLEKAETILRGTLRRKGFSADWNNLVRLGLTDDSFTIHDSGSLTYRGYVSAFTPGHDLASLEDRVCNFLGITRGSDAFEKLAWLGLFTDKPIGRGEATPAQILQALLEEKWKLKEGELDMIVMHHHVGYLQKGEKRAVESSLVVKGEDEVYTAMAKTVGLPLGIAVRLLLQGKVKASGVQMPVSAQFYDPMLEELAEYEIVFSERQA